MEDHNAASKIQNIMKKRKIKQIGTLRRMDGTYTGTPKETLEELLHRLFPDDTEFTEYLFNINLTNLLNEEQILEIVNKTTTKSALQGFKPYKSPGEDGIYPIMIQKG